MYLHVSALHIVPTAPSGLYNQPYVYQFRTLEDRQPVLWRVAPGDRLPAGLKLSPEGLLSGIPAETGPFTFIVRANDASARVTLTIESGSAFTY